MNTYIHISANAEKFFILFHITILEKVVHIANGTHFLGLSGEVPVSAARCGPDGVCWDARGLASWCRLQAQLRSGAGTRLHGKLSFFSSSAYSMISMKNSKSKVQNPMFVGPYFIDSTLEDSEAMILFIKYAHYHWLKGMQKHRSDLM
jgi:hypothetical protein